MNDKPKRIRVKQGDVFRIALPDGRFAYGRVYNDASVGIYRPIDSEGTRPPIGSRDFRFHVGLYDSVLKSGQCPIIGRDPFANTEESWPPPYSMKDVFTGKFSIYHRGEIRPSTEAECRGLEQAAVWELGDVIDRIMKCEDADSP